MRTRNVSGCSVGWAASRNETLATLHVYGAVPTWRAVCLGVGASCMCGWLCGCTHACMCVRVCVHLCPTRTHKLYGSACACVRACVLARALCVRTFVRMRVGAHACVGAVWPGLTIHGSLAGLQSGTGARAMICDGSEPLTTTHAGWYLWSTLSMLLME